MGQPVHPSRARYVVLAFLCGLTFILYLDRVCIGQAAPAIRHELGLTPQQMGWVFWAFTIAYGLFEIPTGHWGDRHGPRRVLTRIVLWWSAFTAFTGMVQGFVGLLLVRFLFGAGEAGALPNTVRVTGTWFPESSRGRIRGIIMMPALVGGMVAPFITQLLMDWVGWREVFVIYGLIGIAWAIAFWSWFRDRPADHFAVNEAERELIGPPAPPAPHGMPPLARMVGSRNLWRMSLAMISGAIPIYTLFSWFPSYLIEVRKIPELDASLMSSLVMFGGAVGCIVGGYAADLANRRFRGTRWTRSSVGGGGFTLAAAAMGLGVSLADWPILMSACFAVTSFGIHCHGAAWWGAAQDLGGKYVGTLFAVGNSIGVFGAGAAILAFGYVPQERWSIAFAVCAGQLAIGALLWAQVDTRRPLDTRQVSDAAEVEAGL
jgi:ACS family glucarate transporter-like MFS transporter